MNQEAENDNQEKYNSRPTSKRMIIGEEANDVFSDQGRNYLINL